MVTVIGASVAYFGYVAVVGLVLPGLASRRRLLAVGLAALGLGLTAIAFTAEGFWLASFLLPLLLLLVGYWASGTLWVAPQPRFERLLAAVDTALDIPRLAARLPRILCELLELSYVGIYALIPIAPLLHVGYAPDADPYRFWTVVLVTDYICFAMLPWIQTRPPRALESVAPCRSSIRTLNLGILDRTSIGVNTVPSGHAAEAMAIALLLMNAPDPIALLGCAGAILVSAGAVAGRYHYLLDVLAGWAVAIAVFLAAGGRQPLP
jgi:membrane-associated phospholipid phosphatase